MNAAKYAPSIVFALLTEEETGGERNVSSNQAVKGLAMAYFAKNTNFPLHTRGPKILSNCAYSYSSYSQAEQFFRNPTAIPDIHCFVAGIAFFWARMTRTRYSTIWVDDDYFKELVPIFCRGLVEDIKLSAVSEIWDICTAEAYSALTGIWGCGKAILGSAPA